MKVRIFTNEVAGGWLPTDLDKFLGGSEECVVLLAEALVRSGNEVHVYHTQPEPNVFMEHNGVLYYPREDVVVDKGDALISFKTNLPWRGLEQDAGVKIHWSSDIEDPWDTNDLDYFVHLTPFHKQMHIWLDGTKSVIVPHGIDKDSLDRNFQEVQELKSILYCSSPDRGLGQLLDAWPKIHARGFNLKVAYGFRNLRLMGGQRAEQIEKVFMDKMDQPGIEYLGQLTKDRMEREYWKNEYWILPLQIPSSELFCLNALKAQYCGCTPIVNRIGALQDTVGTYIDYNDFVNGEQSYLPHTPFQRTMTWDSVVAMYWEPMLHKCLGDPMGEMGLVGARNGSALSKIFMED